MNAAPLRIGSRASPLARTQTEWFASRLDRLTALVWIRSEGDRDRTTALRSLGGTGVFTKALHDALFEDRIDAAVHSLKDLPAGDEAGILLGCVPVREDPRDALVTRGDVAFERLPRGARIGTGSPRRAAQLRHRRPDVVTEPLRGNVDTRLAHVRDGRLDGVVLALAGLRRLGREDVVSEILEPDLCLPAAGQGALGVTQRAGDAATEEALAAQRDVRAAATTAAERAALHALGAGCHAPVGALATVAAGRLSLHVRVLALDGSRALDTVAEGTVAEARVVGERAAAGLLDQGAGLLLGTP
ncbi:MAG: hydroxymethylbilane synthase [Planctomycetota bacterium]